MGLKITSQDFTVESIEDHSGFLLTLTIKVKDDKKDEESSPITGDVFIKRIDLNKELSSLSYSIEKAKTYIFTYKDYSAKLGEGYQYDFYFQESGTTWESLDLQTYYLTPDDSFLETTDRKLKLRYDPDISNVKRVVGDAITQTLGAKYPFVRRNGDMEYRQFNIGGLISIEAEDINNSYFLDNDEKDCINSISSIYSDERSKQIIQERIFRDAVLEYLYSADEKIFRSMQEGDILVRLTNVSLTPNKQLGRMIYSFSAQATEIGEILQDTYSKKGYHRNSTEIVEVTQ